MKYRAVIKHSSLEKDFQTWGVTMEYIDSWLKANEHLIPDGATVQVFEIKEILVKEGVVKTITEGEGSKLEKAGLLKDNTDIKDVTTKGAKRK